MPVYTHRFDGALTLHFGLGDIAVCTARAQGSEIEDEILFVPDVAQPVGDPATFADDLTSADLKPAVRFVLPSRESIEVIIEQLWKVMHPKSTGVEVYRSELARLEGYLSVFAGKPLRVYEHGRYVRDIPPGGAVLEYSPALARYSTEDWYPTTEQAKAALLLIARSNGVTPDSTGLHVDVSPPAAQYSTTYRVTRRS